MENTSHLVRTGESRGPAPVATAVDAQRVDHRRLTGVVAIADAPVQSGLAHLRRLVRELAARNGQLPFDPHGVEELALAGLRESLSALLGRPVVLELHIARLQGGLVGGTPEERFRAFVGRLADGVEAGGLMHEYPVLARQIEICIDHWVVATGEFLRRLCDDWDDIRATFCAEECPGLLVGIETGVADKHREGRSVIVASFSSGFRVVYKPRSLAVDVHFQDLLRWVDDRGDHPRFRTLSIIDRGRYGWVEFVRSEGCSTPAQVRRFYRRQGGYLALLHVLCAVDFHHENLIAAGEHPVLVDVEALFHPELFDDEQTAEATFRASVLAVGLLPYRLVPDGKAEGIDISGLGAVEGALWPDDLPRWERAGTDEMRLTRARVPFVSGAHHRPMLDGAVPDLAEYASEVAAGFTSIYDLCRTHRADMVAKDGPVARFAADEVRVLVRPTRTYAALLHASLHPDVLRSAAERGKLLDKLSARVDALPVLGRVVGAERHDLAEGDVPLFTTRPRSRDLWTSRGVRLRNVIAPPGLDLVTTRLQRLGPADLARQQWFIRASFASLAPSALPDTPTNGPTPSTTHRPSRRAAGPSPERLLALACAVGDRVAALPCRADGACSWIGMTLSDESRWTPAPLDSSLYGGLPGVGLFLAQLGSTTGEDRFTALAQEVLATWRARRELDWSRVTGIGALEGWGGAVYLLARLGSLWEDEALLADAEAIVERLPALIEQNETFDFFGGAAGCIMGLLALHAVAPSERTLHTAVACGHHLLSGAQPMDQGSGWLAPGEVHAPLSGLSHGAAGIAMALDELWAATGCEPFRTAALEALAYERSLFSAETGNWADLRPLPPGQPEPNGARPRFMTALCHGAPGIGLARVRMLRHANDPEIARDVDVALETTLRYGWGRNHSLCHGDLGNLELLLDASLASEEDRWSDELGRVSLAVVEDIERRGWRCANPDEIESPELMTGLAGIGYALLRLAAPALVPSVLVLSPAPSTTVPALPGAVR